jgi:hypothetical protein
MGGGPSAGNLTQYGGPSATAQGIQQGTQIGFGVTGLAQGITGIASSIQNAQAQAGADTYNAKIAAQNAQTIVNENQTQQQQFNLQNEIEGLNTDSQVSRMTVRNGQLEAQQISASASSGVTLTGSTADVVRSSAVNNAYQANQALYQGQLKQYQTTLQAQSAQYNSTIQANAQMDQAQLDQSEARNATTAGIFGAIGSGIQTIGSGAEVASFL